MANSTCWFSFFITSPRHVCRICGRAARTSAPHAHGRQFDRGWVYGQAGILEPWWSGLDSARIGGKTKHEHRESNVFALKRPRRTFPASWGLTTADTRKILEETVSCAFGRRGPWEARSETWMRNHVSSKLRADTPQNRCGWVALAMKDSWHRNQLPGKGRRGRPRGHRPYAANGPACPPLFRFPFRRRCVCQAIRATSPQLEWQGAPRLAPQRWCGGWNACPQARCDEAAGGRPPFLRLPQYVFQVVSILTVRHRGAKYNALANALLSFATIRSASAALAQLGELQTEETEGPKFDSGPRQFRRYFARGELLGSKRFWFPFLHLPIARQHQTVFPVVRRERFDAHAVSGWTRRTRENGATARRRRTVRMARARREG